MSKLGRNDLCSCGSGKKYKKCCINEAHSNHYSEVADSEWLKLRQLEGGVIDKHLLPYITKLPKDVMSQAISDCLPEEDLPEEIDKELLFNHFILPWSLFNWLPLENFGLEQFDPEKTLSQNYLMKCGHLLNLEEKRFIEAMNHTFYSFYSVLQVEQDKSIQVKDILLGTIHILKERQGTYFLERGDLVYSRVLTLNNQSIFVGMAPLKIPVNYFQSVLDFKRWLIEENDGKVLTAEILRQELDVETLDFFFELLATSYKRAQPTLVNTDGELIQFSKTHFKLSISPEEALNALLPMTLTKDPDEFLADAKRTKAGKIKSIECPWLKKGNKKHKSWDNTVHGHIVIKENKLILETNSLERTERAKKLLCKYLGEAVVFQKTLIESPEQKMKSLPNNNSNEDSSSDLMALPEVQEQIKKMAKAHWESWFDEPIPALENQTPREAAKTNDGRERLDALLLQYERHDNEKDEHHLFKADIDYLRKELMLGESNDAI